MKEDLKGGLFQSIVNFARTKYSEEIDKAYEYFFDEDEPKDMIAGTALDLAFMNFEDWLVCDYRTPKGASMIDLFQRDSSDLTEEQKQMLDAMKESQISLYEAISDDGGVEVTIKDLLLGDSFTSSDEMLRSIPHGDVFATRFIQTDEGPKISRCVYPFGAILKDKVLEYVNLQFDRYKKHKNPEGNMRQFLRDENYMFNIIWINSILIASDQDTKSNGGD